MAAGYLSPPGTEFGPCEECDHHDCGKVRAEAESKCKLCGKSIGYHRGFYRDDEYGNAHRMVHAVCLEEKVL